MTPDETHAYQANQSQKARQFELLTQCAPGTPMGTLLRRFWQPVAQSAKLEKGRSLPLRLLGEELTLYRGESSKPYLVAGRCAHRSESLHNGRVQGEQIRCMYHGWRYDGAGLCHEIPAEKQPRSEPVRIAAYPVHEYCGLVFAWMGELNADGTVPAFDLPRKHALDETGRSYVILEQVWDVNWFQQIENSMDAVHLSFAHGWGKVGRFAEAITSAIPDLAYSETSAGIRQIATRSPTNVRISDWTFPNNNHIVAPGPGKDDPWTDISVWAVPIDERNTRRFTLYAYAARVKPEDLDTVFQPRIHAEWMSQEQRIPSTDEAGEITAQDYVATSGQGTIVDRTKENLSVSDAGIVFLRKVFWRELDAIAGGRPTKQWSPLDEAPHLPIPEKQAAAG